MKTKSCGNQTLSVFLMLDVCRLNSGTLPDHVTRGRGFQDEAASRSSAFILGLKVDASFIDNSRVS